MPPENFVLVYSQSNHALHPAIPVLVRFEQHDDQRMVEEASKIDFGLGLPKVG